MTILLSENFNAAGTPSGWTTSGSGIDFDNTSSPIEGAQSLSITAPSTAYVFARTPTFAAQTTIEVYVRFAWGALPASASATFIELEDGSNVDMAYVQARSGQNRIRVGCGTITADGPIDLVAGTVYHFWLVYTAGSGANAVFAVYYSTDGVRPDSPQVNITTGDSTGSIQFVTLTSNNRSQQPHKYDYLVIANEEIGDNGDVDVTPNPGLIFDEDAKYFNGTTWVPIANATLEYAIFDRDVMEDGALQLGVGTADTNASGTIDNIDRDDIGDIDDQVCIIFEHSNRYNLKFMATVVDLNA